MKKNITIVVVAVVMTILLAGMLLVPRVTAAGGLYLTPGSRTATVGSSFTVSIRMSSGSAVNAVQANITYPSDKLTYVSTSFGGTAFEIQAESSGGGGAIRIARGTVSAVTGDKLVASITFRAKVDAGTAAIAFAGDSTLVNNGASVSSGGSGATITFAVAPPPPIAPVVDKTPPSLADIAATDITQKTATISWTTNEAADSVVDYGLSTNYGLTIANTEKVTAHKVIVASSFMQEKTIYHYRVSTTDASGNKTVSDDKTFTTAGHKLDVKVLLYNKKPAIGAIVKVDGENQTTDKTGVAHFDVTSGNKTVAATLNDVTTSNNVKVSVDAKETIIVELVLPKTKNALPIGWIAGGGFGLFVLGVLASTLLRSYLAPVAIFNRKGSFAKRHLTMPISTVQKRFGDPVPANNPYLKKWHLPVIMGRIIPHKSH